MPNYVVPIEEALAALAPKVEAKVAGRAVKALPKVAASALEGVLPKVAAKAPKAAARAVNTNAVTDAPEPSLGVDMGLLSRIGDQLPKAPATISARSGTPLAVAQDVLQEAAKPSKGRVGYGEWRAANPGNGRLFDMSRLSEVPDVPQSPMPRYQPPRGPSARIVEALERPEVERGINDVVERGIAGGGMQWYNTDPALRRMESLVGGDAPSRYAGLMDIVAATSPRSKVTDNVRTASYYNYLRSQGLPIPDKPAGGYGSIAQNLHRDNMRGLETLGGWDIFKNPKPASFSTNLQGNQMNATIDTHNFRLPGILAEDPRFLETSIAELADSPEAGLDTLRRQYPGLPEEVVQASVKTRPGEGLDSKGNPKPDKHSITYRPQEWVKKGYIQMDDALQDPALWASKPKDNEYGFYEDWQRQQAAKYGVSPAQYQASMWLGGGETTGLGSAAEPFLGTLDARVSYTADQLGLDREKVLDMMLRGDVPLLADGGPVRARYACGGPVRESLAVAR